MCKLIVSLGVSAALQMVVTTVNISKGAGHFPIFPILLHGILLVISHHKLFNTLFSYCVRKTQL